MLVIAILVACGACFCRCLKNCGMAIQWHSIQCCVPCCAKTRRQGSICGYLCKRLGSWLCHALKNACKIIWKKTGARLYNKFFAWGEPQPLGS